MDVVIVVILLLFGVAIGSFLNVVIYRFNPERGLSLNALRGRSHCPSCSTQLKWFELIPVFSFLIQLRKCRSCGEKISWQYPVVEILSGAVFVFTPMFLFNFYGLSHLAIDLNYFYALSGLWVLVLLSWLVITFIDLKHYIIPNKINVFIGVLGVLIVVSKVIINELVFPFHESFLKHYSLLFSPSESLVFNHILGALVAGGFFLFIALVTRGKGIGWGDVKLMFFSGIVLGWPDILIAMIITFLLGGVFGAYYLITGKRKMKDKIPFGPFLVVGMVIVVFFGFSIIQGYLNLIGI